MSSNKSQDFGFKIKNKELFLEYTLIELNFPLFFICKDSSGQRYVSMLVDENEGYYLISPVSVDKILKLISKQITLKEMFNNKTVYKVITDENDINDDQVTQVSFSSIDENDLPKDEYLSTEYLDNIGEYQNKLSCIVNKCGFCNSDTEPNPWNIELYREVSGKYNHKKKRYECIEKKYFLEISIPDNVILPKEIRKVKPLEIKYCPMCGKKLDIIEEENKND